MSRMRVRVCVRVCVLEKGGGVQWSTHLFVKVDVLGGVQLVRNVGQPRALRRYREELAHLVTSGPTPCCGHRHDPSQDSKVWRWLEKCEASHYTFG